MSLALIEKKKKTSKNEISLKKKKRKGWLVGWRNVVERNTWMPCLVQLLSRMWSTIAAVVNRKLRRRRLVLNFVNGCYCRLSIVRKENIRSPLASLLKRKRKKIFFCGRGDCWWPRLQALFFLSASSLNSFVRRRFLVLIWCWKDGGEKREGARPGWIVVVMLFGV